ncbi:granzyme B-like [Archocentrus centrarchus]|uniref:granzyme B-like n=1 Tax=Archocentrus centrarchus TaxID=63155 RepID=UPI0011EA4DA7|nr:granzyme B-like [Archocentrus centrarchus]
MFIHWSLLVLIFVLILHDQVHTGEIIGGHEASPHSRPYMVLLQMHRTYGHPAHCGGFLLNEDFVMTAAHCHATSYKVLLGLHDFHKQNGVQHVLVEKSFPHDDYDGDTYENDIMLLKLSSKAVFNKNVKSIVLADRGDDSLPQSCVVSGWGRTKTVNHMSVKLMEANVTLIDNQQCASAMFYCSQGETGPGVGDSGGPLVCGDGKAYGVVSTSSSPNPDVPTIYRYTMIPHYRDWVDSIIKQHGNY